ncbi:MAG: hypothetical protein IKF38_05845 [Clostridia bacterium]|nr:hypothetical protein [Clostridia bacterium]
MYNIIRYIRQNRIKIIGIVLFILFAYSMIITANKTYENQEKQKIQNSKETAIQTDGTVTLSEKNCKKVIEEFLENCTKGQYEKAYTYLSQDCKKSKYPTLEDFENKYCVANAMKGKGYKIEKNTKFNYKIELNDILSTGKESTKRIFQYYSITVDNGHDIKINIE